MGLSCSPPPKRRKTNRWVGVEQQKIPGCPCCWDPSITKQGWILCPWSTKCREQLGISLYIMLIILHVLPVIGGQKSQRLFISLCPPTYVCRSNLCLHLCATILQWNLRVRGRGLSQSQNAIKLFPSKYFTLSVCFHKLPYS